MGHRHLPRADHRCGLPGRATRADPTALRGQAGRAGRHAERERDPQAPVAVAEERTRIARELHDVVAHSMAVMIVQADGADYPGRRPGDAREAIKLVAETGRAALEEMRRLVGVLREDHGGARPARRARSAADRLGQLTALSTAPMAGLRVAAAAGAPPACRPRSR